MSEYLQALFQVATVIFAIFAIDKRVARVEDKLDSLAKDVHVMQGHMNNYEFEK